MSWNMDTFMPAELAQASTSVSDNIADTNQSEAKGKSKGVKKPKQPGEAGPKRKRKYNTQKNAAAASGSTSIDGINTGEASQIDGTGSRPGSTAPNQQGITTPTKRRMSTAGGGGGNRKASRGRARGSTQAENRASRGSRGTSARVSQSVNPVVAVSAQPQGEDEEEDAEGLPEDENEIEDDEEEEEGIVQDIEEEEWHRQEAIQKAKSTAMGPLMRAMDDVQQDRYSVYRTSTLDKRHVRRLIYHLTSQVPSQQVQTLASAITKVYVGEIVERSRKIQSERGGTGPLRPEHLTEANRQYKKEREIPGRYPPGMHSTVAGTGGNGKRRRLF